MLCFKLSSQRNETETKLFQTCFEAVSFQFLFVGRTVLVLVFVPVDENNKRPVNSICASSFITSLLNSLIEQSMVKPSALDYLTNTWDQVESSCADWSNKCPRVLSRKPPQQPLAFCLLWLSVVSWTSLSACLVAFEDFDVSYTWAGAHQVDSGKVHFLCADVSVRWNAENARN